MIGFGDPLFRAEDNIAFEESFAAPSNFCVTRSYNLDCSGFVQIANNIYLGRGFDHYSSADGDQWGFNLQWKRNTDGFGGSSAAGRAIT